MKFWKKEASAPLEYTGLSTLTKRQRTTIRKLLRVYQKGFCAYTEKFVSLNESTDVEHFDPRIKNRTGDGYTNWYFTCNWANNNRPKKIERFLPILHPSSPDAHLRFEYISGTGAIRAKNSSDQDAKNLENFIGLSKPQTAIERYNHVQRVKRLIEAYNNDLSLVESILVEDPLYLSYPTALEIELGIDVDRLISSLVIG